MFTHQSTPANQRWSRSGGFEIQNHFRYNCINPLKIIMGKNRVIIGEKW